MAKAVNKDAQDQQLNMKLSINQKEIIHKKAEKYGFNSIASYMKFASMNAVLTSEIPKKN